MDGKPKGKNVDRADTCNVTLDFEKSKICYVGVNRKGDERQSLANIAIGIVQH